MDLPSFLWLWRIAAWSMGLSVALYCVLALTGGMMLWKRKTSQERSLWLRPLHFALGGILVFLVLLLLVVGLIGTFGHYGNLGHSSHLLAGLTVVALTLASAWSATQININKQWARTLHVSLNGGLFIGFLTVALTGWRVVQKYLP